MTRPSPLVLDAFPDSASGYQVTVRTYSEANGFVQVVDDVSLGWVPSDGAILRNVSVSEGCDYVGVYLYRDGMSPNDICYIEFDTATTSKIVYESSLGKNLYDLSFQASRLLALVDDGSGSSLRSLSRTSPYAELAKVSTFAGESGVRLVPTSGGVLVVTRDGMGIVHVRSYTDAELSQTNIVKALAGTASLPATFIPFEGRP